MCIHRFMATIVVATVLSACAGPVPAPAPADDASAGVGILLTVRAPVKMFSTKEDRVMFIRLDDEQDAPYLSTKPIASNYVKDGYIYLLNVPPGRYAAVASFRSQSAAPATPPPGSSGVNVTVNPGDSDFSTFFSVDVIKATTVTVEPGQLAFIGEVVVDSSTHLENADDAQAHYYRLLAPGAEDKSGFKGMMSGSYYYTGSLHTVNRDEAAYGRFLDKSTKNLGERGWAAMLH